MVTAIAAALLIGLAALAITGLHVIREDERGVVLRFGALRRTERPGLKFMLPWAERVTRVSVKTVIITDQYQQNCRTQDGSQVTVHYLARLRVADAARALLKVDDWQTASLAQAAAAVRSAIGTRATDSVLTEWPRLGECLSAELSEITCMWGVLPDVEITAVTPAGEIDMPPNAVQAA